MTTKPRLLIIAFSPLASDARVRKQIDLFAPLYDVTTCGFGPAYGDVAAHIRIPDGLSDTDLYGRLITAKQYRFAYWRLSAIAWALSALRSEANSAGAWDVVLANDVEAVPLAWRLKPRLGVHADLHEYSPRLHEEHDGWRKRIAPYYRWLCRRYVARCQSITTVATGIADEYAREFGFTATVVTNATPAIDHAPGDVHNPVRLVHSGAGLRNRNLEVMVEAVAALGDRVTLDLYLMRNDPTYLDELQGLAAAAGNVQVLDPVPYDELVDSLNEYDVGLMVLPPVNFSYLWAMPNKLYDYLQARLAMVVGPSPEMARFVSDHELGLVTADFTAASLRDALDRLDAASIAGFKASADRWATELTADREVATWRAMVGALMEGKSHG